MEVARCTVIEAVVAVKRNMLYVNFGEEGGVCVAIVTGKSVTPDSVRP